MRSEAGPSHSGRTCWLFLSAKPSDQFAAVLFLSFHHRKTRSPILAIKDLPSRFRGGETS